VLGSKTELKNMNSFKAVEKSLEHEIKRQKAILESGKEVVTQTLRWEESSGKTIAMRGKLQAHDYRCFTDPELAPVELTREEIEAARAALPEMAEERAARFVEKYSLPDYDAGVLTSSIAMADYFEQCLELYNNPKTVCNWVMGELTAKLNSAGLEFDHCTFEPSHLAELLKMIDDNLISGKIAKEVLDQAFESGKPPRQVVEEQGLLQISDQSSLSRSLKSDC
jgi:aspartyl-tRNA(Asn)/glutamyl-tRNA(Gln) amidotransferase subunit B